MTGIVDQTLNIKLLTFFLGDGETKVPCARGAHMETENPVQERNVLGNPNACPI